MTKPTYYEMLRDPRWQRKRLEVMQRDGFRCRECGDDSTTLNVHHGYYAKGRKPWEYENASLSTLCEPCHEAVTGQLAEIHRSLGLLGSYDMDRVQGFLRALAVAASWPRGWEFPEEGAARIRLESDSIMGGVAEAFYLTYEELQAVMAKDETVGPAEINEAIHRHLAARRTVADLEGSGDLG